MTQATIPHRAGQKAGLRTIALFEAAKGLGVISGSIYIPVEGYELTQGATWAKCTILVVNLSIVSYLVYTMPRPDRMTSNPAK